jgi:predicted ThiF/HesA family dinucleotide-utilizing enzyme
MNIKWTQYDKDFIREKAAIMKDDELTIALADVGTKPVSIAAVRKLRQRLGIKKQPGRGVCKLLEEKTKKDNTDENTED